MDQNNIPANHSNTPDDEIDFRELIITLLKGWKIIVATTVIVTVLAAIYAYRLPDQYVVTTKAATVGGGSSNSQMAGLAALAGVNIGGGEKEVDLLEHIDVVIKNSHFMDALLEKEWVIPREHNKKQGSSTPLAYDTMKLEEYWHYPDPDTSLVNWEYLRKRSLYSRLRSTKLSHLSVENSKGILKVKTKFENPELSYQVHNAVLSLLRDYFRNDYTSRDREKRIFIEDRLKEVDVELKKSEGQLMKFREKNLMATAPRVILEGERLKREVELQASLYKELIKQLEIAKIDEKKEIPVFEVLQYPELPLYSAEPNRKLLLLLGVVLGGGLGVFIVFIIKMYKKLFLNIVA